MYNKLVEILNLWDSDIHTISINHYKNYIECLINEHYILTIKNNNI